MTPETNKADIYGGCFQQTSASVNERNDDQITGNASTAGSAAAARMRRHRERRRDGLRCVTIELRETEINALIRCGLLKSDTRHDPNAIKDALYEFLDRTLGTTP
jgi:hypothetical protein